MQALLLATFFIGLPIGLYWALTARRRQWRRMLTLDEYVAAYPSAKTPAGMRCCRCGSRHLRNFGLDDTLDNRRYIRCVHCDTPLYRIQWKDGSQ